MSTINDGGNAFPDGSLNEWGNAKNGGMALRDYFAAKALSGVLADSNVTIDLAEDADILAGAVYRIADAMLRARAS